MTISKDSDSSQPCSFNVRSQYRNGNIPQNMFLMLAARRLREILAHTMVSDPESMCRRFVPGQSLSNPRSNIGITGSGRSLSLFDKGDNLLAIFGIWCTDHSCFHDALVR